MEIYFPFLPILQGANRQEIDALRNVQAIRRRAEYHIPLNIERHIFSLVFKKIK